MSQAKPNKAAQLRLAHPSTRNIVLECLINKGGGGKIHDYSRKQKDGGIFAGGTSWTDGFDGTAILLVGSGFSGNEVSFGTSPSYDFGTGAFGIFIIIQRQGNNPTFEIFASKDTTGKGWYLLFTSTNKVRFGTRNAGAGDDQLDSNITVPHTDRNWWVIFAGRDSSGNKILFLRSLTSGVTDTATSNDGSRDISVPSFDLQLGHLQTNNHANCKIDAFTMYKGQSFSLDEAKRYVNNRYERYARPVSPARYFFLPSTPPSAENDPYPPNCAVAATDYLTGKKLGATDYLTGKKLGATDYLTGEKLGATDYLTREIN